MPSHAAVGGLEGTLVDGEYRLLEPRPTPIHLLMGTPMITPGPQRRAPLRRQSRWPQEPGSGLVDHLVDALVTQPHRPVGGVLRPQVPADLLRTPPLPKQVGEQAGQGRVGLDPTPMFPATSGRGATVGLEGTVAAAPAAGGVAAQLPGDRRRRTAQPPRDLPHAEPAVAQ